jgi:hypothetical protein
MFSLEKCAQSWMRAGLDKSVKAIFHLTFPQIKLEDASENRWPVKNFRDGLPRRIKRKRGKSTSRWNLETEKFSLIWDQFLNISANKIGENIVVFDTKHF